MGPQDHLRALLDGIGCTVCEEPVPADRVRLLARRDDLIFLQVECAACGSTSLGFIADDLPDAPLGGDNVEAELDGGPEAAAISTDDVLDMHTLLDAWTGDLQSLVRAPASERGGRPGLDDRQAGRTA